MSNWINLSDLIEVKRKSIEFGYASGNGFEANPERQGFKEFAYQDGEWEVRDGYAGYFRSWGEELIRFKGQPVWVCLYGGGMVEKYSSDSDFAHETFAFLKHALMAGSFTEKFNPRGPDEFIEGDWHYGNEMTGDAENFQGSETIQRKGETVFTHKFIGGLISGK